MSNSQERKKSMSTFWRVFPGIVFAVALIAIVIGVYGGSDGKNDEVESRYLAAKKSMTELLNKSANKYHSEKWRKLSDEFFDIYSTKMQWEKSAAALFLAAESTELLANYTLLSSDYKLSIERYEQLALTYSKNALADDALYRAASIRAEKFKDIKAAQKLLKRISTQYKHSDMLSESLSLEKKLMKGVVPPNLRKSDYISGFMYISQYLASIQDYIKKNNIQASFEKNKGKTEENIANKNKDKPAQLTKISWSSKSGTQVEIVVELNKSVNWETVIQKSKAGSNKLNRIALQLSNTVAINQVKVGAKVKKSLLTQISVQEIPAGLTKVYFDFKEVKGYNASIVQKPYRLVILVDAKWQFKNKGMKQNSKNADSITLTSQIALSTKSKKVNKLSSFKEKNIDDSPQNIANLKSVDMGKSLNLAEQLGLGVREIFIDAGHGGRDPGATKNGIIESTITLDIAKRLGKILVQNGFKVHYSRTKNVSIPVSSRSQKANELKSDLFISIHVNANKDVSVAGFETYYLDFATTKRAAMAATLENAISDRTLGQLQTVMASIMLNEKKYESIRLAHDIKKVSLLKIISSGFKANDGGVRSAPFHVLIDASMPSVLVEVGYCTNINDAKKLANPKYRQALAEGIAEGIIEYNSRFKAGNS